MSLIISTIVHDQYGEGYNYTEIAPDGPGVEPSGDALVGSYAYASNSAQPGNSYAGVAANNFVNDYYYRVHVVPRALDLGNLLSIQTRDIEVWSAYFVTKLLSSIDEDGTDGIVLTRPQAAPTTFQILESRIYEANIDVRGSPIIDATYTFNFPNESPTLEITGNRVVVWPFIPQTKHREQLEWKTDIIKSFNKEQRLALRVKPRQSFTYDYQFDSYQFSRAKAISSEWAHRVYGCPVWSEMTWIGPLTSGITEVLFDTSDADYRANDVFLIWESDTEYEAVENLEVLSDRINLKIPLLNSYNNAFVMPLRYARTLQGIQYKRSSTDIVEAKNTFQVSENIDLGTSTGFDQYRSIDVMTDRAVLTRDIQERISRQIDIFDNGSGPIDVDVKRGWVDHSSQINFDTLDRAERWRARQWLHSRRGKQKPFWLPSWNNDLILQADALTAATSLTCSPIDFDLYYSTKDIMIQLRDGTRLYNRVLTAVTDGEGNELLGLEIPLSEDVLLSNVELICFMSHARLNTDRVVVSHDYGGRAIMPVTVTETPEE